MTEHGTPEEPTTEGEPAPFTEDAPTPPNGLSLQARQWQQGDDEDVRQLDFNQFRSDR